MDLTPYLDTLRRELAASAAVGDAEFRSAAERLGHALDPAARIALMEALSHATAEITAALPNGGVSVRLEGRDLAFVVDQPPAAPADATAPEPAEPEPEGDLARVSLRLPESVKARAEEQATAAGMSLNTWLVSVVRSATRADHQAVRVDVDVTSIPTGRGGHRGRDSRRITGWI